MKNDLQHRVLLLLKAVGTMNKHELFNAAFELYKETPEKQPSIEVKLNRIGFTDEGLSNLLYDLQKLHNISDTEIASAESEVEKKEVELNIAVASLNKLTSAKNKDKSTIKAASEAVDELVLALEALQTVVEETTPELVIVADETEDVSPEVKQLLESTEDQAELQPLRTEFPFLNDKDCPEVLFVVVGKRISAYRRYQALHAQLIKILEGKTTVTAEEQSALAFETQEANAENLSLWNELNHYATTGEILGKHSLFKEIVAKREVDAMTMDQLAKYRTSSSTFISKKRTAMKAKGLTAEKKAVLEEAITDREYKLALVNTKLGVDGSK